MEEDIELGDTVQDIHTGFIGVAVARTVFLNGCVQFEVMPKVGKDNKQSEPLGIDDISLKIIRKKAKPKPVKKKPTGGAYNKGISQSRGF